MRADVGVQPERYACIAPDSGRLELYTLLPWTEKGVRSSVELFSHP